MSSTSSRSPRIIHTAQALVDLVVSVPTLPPRGGNVFATGEKRYAASAVNILVAAARSGATCVHAGSVGSGPNADVIRAALDLAGVTISSPPITDRDSGVCLVLVERSAERTFVTTLGAERQISATSLATSAPEPGDLICVSGYSLVAPTVGPLLEWLEQCPEGVRVVLDPGAIFAELPDEVRRRMLALTTLWTGNLAESQALLGSQADMLACAQALPERLSPGADVVVRDGDKGCAVTPAGGAAVRVDGFPQQAVDTNGAGDCHTGVLCAGLGAGAELVEAARRANAAAAIKVQRHGPDQAPGSAEIDAFLAAN